MSNIEYTHRTWNPIIGCSKESEGCANCYAEKMAARLARIEKTAYYGEVLEDGKWNGNVIVVPSQLKKPMQRKKPTIYFVGSMCDLFHDNTPVKNLNDVFWVMGMCSQHRFIVLTKRAEQMQWYMSLQEIFCKTYKFSYPLPNVLLGVTAENQEQADKRIPILLDTPAAARFVSVEPMLGAVDLTEIGKGKSMSIDALRGRMESTAAISIDPSPAEEFTGLDWVIVGGESGPGARPMHPDWARSLRDQCAAASVPFFFKQWGESVDDLNRNARANAKGAFWMIPDGTTGKGQPEPEGCVWMNRIGKKAAGNLLDGQQYEEYPALLREVQNV